MESIAHFFGKVLGGFIDRLSDQIRYKISDVAESKLRETVEKPFERNTKNNHLNQNKKNNQHTAKHQD